MHLLELNTSELEEEIRRELQTNPALQLLDEIRCPECGRRLRTLPCPACLAKHQADSGDAPIVFLSPRLPFLGDVDAESDDSPTAERVPQTETLAEHLLRQVACATNVEEQRIAAYILERLDDRGLFLDHPAEVALALRVPLESAERVLKLIQRADPPGVATRDLRESLLVQLEVLRENGTSHLLVQRMISECWDHLVKRNYALIAKHTRVPLTLAQEAAMFIRLNLTPYPGRAWHDSGRGMNHLARSVFYEPDIVISHNPRPGGPLLVEVFSGMNGTLRVDPEIRASLNQLSDDERLNWANHIDRASLLTKCLQQRNNTMKRLAEIITVEQRAFVLGSDADLKPLTRATLSQRLDVHESTISRAVANKCAALPTGRMVPLSMFFDRSLAVRDAVQTIIKSEQRTAPFSDTKIAELLKPHGYKVARRTVAKYRQMLGILPASLRGREVFLS
jgi:RNA polymerase sigma-54 factor